MKKFLVIAVVYLLLTACGAAEETQIEVPTNTPIPPTQTYTPVPPSPTATSTSIPPTPLPDTLIEPIIKGTDIGIDSWSPDGTWLSFWLWTEGANGLAPPNKLIFLNPHSDEICEYAEFVISEYPRQEIFWQPDGRAAVYLSDSYWLGFPCEDFIPVQAEEVVLPPSQVGSQSPQGTYRAETILLSSEQGGWEQLRTTITNNSTGRIENRVDWQIDARLGSWEKYLGGQWIMDDLFLIYETRDQGPLLIQPGVDILQVAPDLFGVQVPNFPIDEDDWFSLRAFAAAVENDDHYHILLHGVGVEAQIPQVRLFHSETGTVETLPYKDLWHPGFSPDGGWVLLDSSPKIGGHQSYALMIRPVDPPDSQMREFAKGTYIAAWSPSQSEIAFGWMGEGTVFRFPDGEPVRTWTTGEYSNYPLVWSPTGDFLAVTGNISGEYNAALFVIDIRE